MLFTGNTCKDTERLKGKKFSKLGFPGGSADEESACTARNLGSTHGLEYWFINCNNNLILMYDVN